MDSDRAERERAIQEADRLNADFDRDEWRRAQRQKLKRAMPPTIVCKDYAPRPAPQQPSTPMDAVTQAGWDQWVKNHIAIALKEYHEASVDAIGEAMSEYVHGRLTEEATKLREEIASLHADLTISSAIAKGEISALKGSVPVRKRDVA